MKKTDRCSFCELVELVAGRFEILSDEFKEAFKKLDLNSNEKLPPWFYPIVKKEIVRLKSKLNKEKNR